MLDHVTIWTALADPKRRQIITLLEEKPRTTSEIIQFFDVSRFAVMKHLKVLEQAGLITSTRQGRTRWNYLQQDLGQLLRTQAAADLGSTQLAEIWGLLQETRASVSGAGAASHSTQIEQRLLLQASPAQVFAAFTTAVDSWWSRRESADNQVFLEPVVNGRFYEGFGLPGQGRLFGTVTYIKEDAELHLQGTFELAWEMAGSFLGHNQVMVTFERQQSDTLLVLVHRFVGYMDEAAVEAVRRCWRRLLDQDFQPFVEQGSPYRHDP